MRVNIGDKYGKWTVLKKEPHILREPHYLCRCECGTIRTVRGRNLTSGHSKSCGCKSGGRQPKENNKWKGCNEDCFNCKYPDCTKPANYIRDHVSRSNLR